VDIHQSLKRILQSEDIFGKAFYEVFFERCPQAAQYFEGTNMHRQELMVTMALNLVVQYYSNGYSSVEQYLQHLGTRHHDHSVPPELYPHWRDAMLATMEKFHEDDWNEELAEHWRTAIDAVVKPMMRGYDRRLGA